MEWWGLRVRELQADEVDGALALTGAEGWTFERPELERLLRLGPAFVLDDAGTLRGLLCLTFHGDVAWIGNVVVEARLRGQGHGARLLQAALDDADRRDARTVALYAVPKAVPLYERAGFRADGHLVALGAAAPRAPPTPDSAVTMSDEDLAEVAALDRAALGLDRTHLLAELLDAYPDTAWVVRRDGRLAGFGFAKPAWGSNEIGPVVGDADAQRALLDAAVDALRRAEQGPVEVALPEANGAALAHLRGLGFAESFRPLVMWRGPAPTYRRDRVAAVGGLEKG